MPSLLRSHSATGPQRGTKRHQVFHWLNVVLNRLHCTYVSVTVITPNVNSFTSNSQLIGIGLSSRRKELVAGCTVKESIPKISELKTLNTVKKCFRADFSTLNSGIINSLTNLQMPLLQIEGPSFPPPSLRQLNPEERPTPKKRIRLDAGAEAEESPGISRSHSAPSPADGSFNSSGSVVVAAKHALRKVSSWFSSVWRSPRKSYSPGMAAAKADR